MHSHGDGTQHDGQQHGHQRGHGHGHGRDDGFDWSAMAARLELDAAITEPIVLEVLAEMSAPVGRVLDVGCGPGAVAIAIARALPDAHVTALDASSELLEHVTHAAHAASVGERVATVPGDLDGDLPALPMADLVWAGMVLHHVTDPIATLQRLHDVLAPGGTLVMVEFGDPPRVLPDDAPLLADGTWSRFQAATAAVLTERLGLDPVTVDWPAHLHSAGFVDVTDQVRIAHHPAPLGDVARSWLVAHLEGGVRMATDRLDDRDAAEILALAASVPDRADLSVRASRRIVIARRPHAATTSS